MLARNPSGRMGTPQEVAREMDRIKNGRSILDGVRDQAKALAANLGPGDREHNVTGAQIGLPRRLHLLGELGVPLGDGRGGPHS